MPKAGAASIPKAEQSSAEPIKNGATPVTTLMIRNIPRHYTQGEFLEIVAKLGFANSVDFVYLPWDMNRSANIGYAFVNLKDAALARSATNAFAKHQFRNPDGWSGKFATVSPARIQGLENNLRHVMAQRELRSGHDWPSEPLVLWNGVAVELADLAAHATHTGSADGSEFGEIMDKTASISKQALRATDVAEAVRQSIPPELGHARENAKHSGFRARNHPRQSIGSFSTPTQAQVGIGLNLERKTNRNMHVRESHAYQASPPLLEYLTSTFQQSLHLSLPPAPMTQPADIPIPFGLGEQPCGAIEKHFSAPPTSSLAMTRADTLADEAIAKTLASMQLDATSSANITIDTRRDEYFQVLRMTF